MALKTNNMKFEYNEEEYEKELKGSYKTGCFEIFLRGQFSQDLTSMSTEDLGTFLHEYVHFLQNISTPWGIFAAIVRNNDLCEFVHSMDDKDEIHIPYRFTPSREQLLKRKWLQCSMGTGHLNFPLDSEAPTGYRYEDIEGFPVSMHRVLFMAQSKTGEKREIVIGATIIKESMAAMYQSLIDPNASHPDMPYNVIQFWCKKHFPNIAEDVKKIICLCYISLFSLDPGFSLMCTLKEANAKPELTGWQIFDEYIQRNVIVKGQQIPIAKFFNDLIENYKSSLRGILPCDLVYTNTLLDRVKLRNGIVPILNVINTESFGIMNIQSLIDYLGIPFIHQFDGRQFYPLVDGDKNSCKDVVVISGNAAMYDYFINPNDHGGVCPFKYMCGSEDMECYGSPWLHTSCIFELGIQSIHQKGKTIIRD